MANSKNQQVTDTINVPGLSKAGQTKSDNRQPIEKQWGLQDTNDPWVDDEEPTEVCGQTRQNCGGQFEPTPYTYPSEKYEFVSWDDEIPNILNPEDRTSPSLPAQISQAQILGWKLCFWAGDKLRILMLNQLQIWAGYQLGIEAGNKLEFEAGLFKFVRLFKPCLSIFLHIIASFQAQAQCWSVQLWRGAKLLMQNLHPCLWLAMHMVACQRPKWTMHLLCWGVCSPKVSKKLLGMEMKKAWEKTIARLCRPGFNWMLLVWSCRGRFGGMHSLAWERPPLSLCSKKFHWSKGMFWKKQKCNHRRKDATLGKGFAACVERSHPFHQASKQTRWRWPEQGPNAKSNHRKAARACGGTC